MTVFNKLNDLMECGCGGESPEKDSSKRKDLEVVVDEVPEKLVD